MKKQAVILTVFAVFLISGCVNQSFTDAENTLADYPENSSPFGIAFGAEHAFKQYGESSIQFIRDAGATDFGIHVFWSTIEPENNSYDWSIIDKYVNQIHPGDNAYVVVFTDGWCTTGEVEKGRYTTGILKKGCPLLNENCKQEYRDFIHDLAMHSNGKIKYWQRDIEPATPKHWPAEKKEEYVELQRIFYEEVKLVVPDAVIGGLGVAGGRLSSQEEHLANYFFQNGQGYFDYLDIHLYHDKYTIPERIRQVTDLMHNYGYEKPLIVKECGGPILSEYSDAFNEAIRQLKDAGFKDFSPAVFKWLNNYDNFAALNPKVQIFLKLTSDEQNAKRDRIECRDMIQRYLIILNEGAQKVFWWNLMENHNPTYGPQPIFGKLKLLNENYEELPSYFCYQRMTDKLKDVSAIERIALLDTTLYLYKITKSGSDKPIYVLWHHDEGVDSYDDDTTPSVSATIRVELSGTVTITDVFGNSYTKSILGDSLTLDVDNTPVYIEETDSLSTNALYESGTNNDNCLSGCDISFLSVSGNMIVNEKGEEARLRGVQLDFGSARGDIDAINESDERQSDFLDEMMDYVVTEDDFADLKSMGVNSARLSLNTYRDFEIKPFSYSQENFERLDRVIAWAEKYNIYLILSMRQSPGGHNNNAHSGNNGLNELWSNVTNQERIAELWRQIALRYADKSIIAGFDLLNEPEAPNRTILNKVYLNITEKIRDVDNRHIIFLEKNLREDLDWIDPPLDTSTLLSIHFYTPWDYAGMGNGTYPSIGFDKDALRRELINRINYAATLNLPVYVGEFGAVTRADNYLDYDRDVIGLLEEQNISWGYWNYKNFRGNDTAQSIYYLAPGNEFFDLIDRFKAGEPFSSFSEQNLQQALESLKPSEFRVKTDLKNLLTESFN